jgi:Cof subfamily protein (haloacid dehalogenase superfamily)
METESLLGNWLVTSDIDGTLNNKKRELPRRNLEAITEFVKKGGKFTLASSRSPQSMRRHYEKLPIDIPAVVINGAGIYDYTKEEMIYFSPLSQKAMEDLCAVAKKYPTIDEVVVTKDDLFISGLGLWGMIYVIADKLDHKIIHKIKDVPKENWGKVIFSGPPWRVRNVKKRLEKIPDADFIVVPTSIVSFEVLAKGTHKGSAVLRLAAMLGIDPDHTAAIGDYYNDYEMLTHVGIAACCGQAPRAIKDICEYVTCHCNIGAVADFLDYFERKLKQNS